MKRILIVGILVSVLFSCKSELEKKEELNKQGVKKLTENLTTFINGKIKSENEDLIIDSISILRIDTLNEKKDSIAVQYALLKYVERLNEVVKNTQEQAKIRNRQVQLSKELGSDADFYADESKKLLRNSQENNSKAIRMINHLNKIDSLIKFKKLDTIKTTGYEAIVKIYAHDSNQANRDADSIGFYFDKNLRINTKNIDRANSEIK
ncbi:hypothetical protein [Sphingobacterium siyangense]|uniref:hypothetical protein n=1 Tax=Sphingobacterium siyangense TaxID=459529 RepID=UPI0031F76EEC